MDVAAVPCSYCDHPVGDDGFCPNCGASANVLGKWLLRRGWGRRFLLSETPKWQVLLGGLFVLGGGLLLALWAASAVLRWFLGGL
jgi:hypothetical protein